MTTVAFVISKPIQLLVSLAIIDGMDNAETIDLLITDDFFNAKLVALKIKNYLKMDVKNINNVYFFNEQTLAYKFLKKIKYESIYIDSDVGFKRYIELLKIKIRRSKAKICVYEEGVGTYRNNLYEIHGIYSFLKSKVFRVLGIGCFFGGNFLVSEIYLFNPSKYKLNQNKDLEIKKIIIGVPDVQSKYEILTSKIFPLPLSLKRRLGTRPSSCVVYLSSWIVDMAFIKSLSKSAELVLVKLHPHIKNEISSVFDIVVVDQSIPAEILLYEVHRFCDTVKIYHYGSSTAQYAIYSNCEYVNLK